MSDIISRVQSTLSAIDPALVLVAFAELEGPNKTNAAVVVARRASDKPEVCWYYNDERPSMSGGVYGTPEARLWFSARLEREMWAEGRCAS